MQGRLLFLLNLWPLALAAAGVAWVLWRWLKASDEPVALIVRWIASAIVLGLVFGFAARARDEFSKVAAILVGAVGGLIMVIIWRQKFCEFVGDQFASLYTGGSASAEPTPFYSIAQAKRKRGQYQEAILEVQAQLQKFPTDFQGWMLIAEIQADDLKDLPAAQATLGQLLAQEGHAPKNIAFALNREADWHLKLHQDPDSARAALERIIELLPQTEQSEQALQRIAHLAPAEVLAARKEPSRIQLPRGEQNIGLRREPLSVAPEEEDPGAVAERYARRLEQFPFDNEAREKLAVLYARHYGRLDLASEQLEQLIVAPNQGQKQVVHWINLLADLQIASGRDVNEARETLQRVLELYPNTAAAESATNRMAHLKLEARPLQQRTAIKLGAYEQNIGLKGERFGPPPAR